MGFWGWVWWGTSRSQLAKTMLYPSFTANGLLHAWESKSPDRSFTRDAARARILWLPVLACASMADKAAWFRALATLWRVRETKRLELAPTGGREQVATSFRAAALGARRRRRWVVDHPGRAGVHVRYGIRAGYVLAASHRPGSPPRGRTSDQLCLPRGRGLMTVCTAASLDKVCGPG